MKTDWSDVATRLTSRKFLAFAVATAALFAKLIDGYTWGVITFAYLGINVLQKRLLNGKGKELSPDPGELNK